MNKDKFEGGVRSTVGQGEKFVGTATGDKASEVKGAHNDVTGSAQSAWGERKGCGEGNGRFRFDSRPLQTA